MSTPRIRLFAGPNGSGKSTLAEWFKETYPAYVGIFINADNIERSLNEHKALPLLEYRLQCTDMIDIAELINKHPLYEKCGTDKNEIICENEQLTAKNPVNAYTAAIIADIIRRKLVKKRMSFSFESVMSSPDKIEFLKEAKAEGYRIYLYYIATKDAEINIYRVYNRVMQGGHDVPEDKIVQRYKRSLSLLPDAVKISDRAYIFDNSGDDRAWIAEIENGKNIKYNSKTIPQWVGNALQLQS
jgi:predicted ABC-type ATPase